ncbi:ribosome biogenesis GTPase YlqF [Halobacillus sp. ACCC02827]|uniref:ribosome biogenesis GTPase YlqF n=1 Tax=Bacillaceae TaxID=186817 RepID=UPI0002A4DF18|nr:MULTISPECIES: ribosome biogenesis GTPase YlqF [Bacillaceae]ELK45749.1 ribosomal biogenesis GTPase [Halobacillus sp. BAB-2008]QHT46639.1 ribosome biogenesis GTPase YlqF [Bacillus sp. SB49]WJE17452.1 ribosome biogenesis GTPase YlqF [Halobacillus sp. ACCC02827]
MTIQWYPGHMAKAKREAAEKLKLVDFVIELVDARAPFSSQNPMLHEILQEKPKMIVLMKKDLADPQKTAEWIEYFEASSIPAVAIEANKKQDVQRVVQKAKELGREKLEKLKAKGVRPRASRAMILGIPNVGKSTLINRLANKKMAKTGDKPGVTTKQQWIKVKKEFELLDTPGILWPKFEEEEVGYRLAAIGTIKDQILPKEDVAAYVLDYMRDHYPALLEERFGFDRYDDIMEAFEQIGRKRGCLESGGVVNFEKVSDVILQDLRSGKFGLISLESPE